MGEISECLYDKDSGQKVLMVQGYSDDRLKIAWNIGGGHGRGQERVGEGRAGKEMGLVRALECFENCFFVAVRSTSWEIWSK